MRVFFADSNLPVTRQLVISPIVAPFVCFSSGLGGSTTAHQMGNWTGILCCPPRSYLGFFLSPLEFSRRLSFPPNTIPSQENTAYSWMRFFALAPSRLGRKSSQLTTKSPKNWRILLLPVTRFDAETLAEWTAESP